MTEAPALPLLQRSVNRPPVPCKRAPDLADAASAVMEARRAGNIELGGFVAELRCECALPNCRETVPAVAESHRGMGDRFIVAPAHLGAIATPRNIDDGRVVRAADRFFVIEPNGSAGRHPASARGDANRRRLHSAPALDNVSTPGVDMTESRTTIRGKEYDHAR